ncbi:hypothetical protein IAE29_21625 [Ochrobactrum sp. S46]|nr:hypothetical protein [Ochrobactrum sp. S45]MBK0045937.1 hypothetical protein [Ochrobactrum sp. S46]
MAVLSDYTSGTITLANGSTAVTGTGTLFDVAKFREGDTLQIQNLTAVIASVNSNTSLTLTAPWTGASLTNAPYRARYFPDGARVTAQATTLIELLGNGVLSSLAEIGVEEGKVPVGNATGEYELKPTSGFGLQDPSGSLAKLGAITLEANKVITTDSGANAEQINLGTLGKTLISKDAGSALHYVRGDGSISVGTGIELIASDTSDTAVSAWVKTGLSAYRQILLSIDAATTATGDNISVQVSSNNGSSWISTVGNYTEQAFVASGANTVVVQATPDRISSGALSSSSEQGGVFAEIEISEFNQARRSMYSMSGSRKAPTTFAQELLMRKGIINVLQSFNAIRVLAGTGTMARFSINLWGVR